MQGRAVMAEEIEKRCKDCTHYEGCEGCIWSGVTDALPDRATALLAERDRMRKALEWYADWDNYRAIETSRGLEPTKVGLDMGQRAREAE